MAKDQNERRDPKVEDVLDIFVALMVNQEMSRVSSEFGRRCKNAGIDKQKASLIGLYSLKRVTDAAVVRKEDEVAGKASDDDNDEN